MITGDMNVLVGLGWSKEWCLSGHLARRRTQYSLEAPNVPVQFAAECPDLTDILVPVPQLPVPEVKPALQVDEPAKKTSSSLAEFLSGRDSANSQSADPAQRKQHIPFVPDNAFLEKVAERTQTVGRVLTSSFDRIRQQAGSLLSKTTAVVRGSNDVEAPISSRFGSFYRRASSSECQSTWTEKDTRLTVTADPFHRRSNSGEVFTGDMRSQFSRIASVGSSTQVRPDIRSNIVPPLTFSARSSSSTDPETTSTPFTGSKFGGPETVLATPAGPTVVPQSPRFEARKTDVELQFGGHQLTVTDTTRSSRRQERSKPANASVAQVSSSTTTHGVRTHTKLPHYVVSESETSSPDFRRGNAKTASKKRREYRSKKQVQEVHHSGSLTETTQHQPGAVAPVHGYSTVSGEPSSSENSLEQPSTTSGENGGLGVTPRMYYRACDSWIRVRSVDGK